ncbi:MAG: dTMP kinase [Coriobacteriales bacterium]|jgi:dTMP kinase|nr:dTMP kinase [Coriobacteriales bacterium]
MAEGAHKKPLFITFEGGEGVGKSTQIGYLEEELEFRGLRVKRLREPGQTQVGEQIRCILLDPDNAALTPLCELMLYEAARVQMVREVLHPLLEGKAQAADGQPYDVILCDRFYDSTFAYQGFGRGIALETVNRLNQVAADGIVPERTIVLVNDVEYALTKATKSGADRIEGQPMAFHERVLEGFLELSRREPGRVRIIHSLDDKHQTAELVLAAVEDLL